MTVELQIIILLSSCVNLFVEILILKFCIQWFNSVVCIWIFVSHFCSVHFQNKSSLLTHPKYSWLLQFNDIGSHGTKVVIYNLWCNDDGNLELDFDTDPEVVFLFYWFSFALYCFAIVLSCLWRESSLMQDIRCLGDIKKINTVPAWKELNEQHIAHRFRFSLRVCLI